MTVRKMTTPRERVKAVIHFKETDVLPWIEDFYDETILRWFREGLQVDKLMVIEWVMCFRDGVFLLNWPTVMGFDPHTYFGCQYLFGCYVPVDVGPIPRFKLRVLRENDRYTELLTETGSVARRFRKAEYTWYTMPMFIDFPVKDRQSWEEYKKRLNPNDPRRYPKDWEKEAYMQAFENYQAGNTVLGFNGFYGFGAQIMGIPTFNVMFYKDPQLMHEMVEYWEYFTMETIRDAVETLKDRIDMVYLWEDMAEKHGPCVSPKLYRQFFLPHYKKVIGFLRKNKIDRILMDSDGNVNPLLDLLVEAGITGLWPLEVNAGMDAISLRKKYGSKLFLVGNLDKRDLAKGGEAMRREVDSKLPVLKEMGGYIPGLDHAVHVEFTLQKFQDYAEYLKKYLPY